MLVSILQNSSPSKCHHHPVSKKMIMPSKNNLSKQQFPSTKKTWMNIQRYLCKPWLNDLRNSLSVLCHREKCTQLGDTNIISLNLSQTDKTMVDMLCCLTEGSRPTWEAVTWPNLPHGLGNEPQLGHYGIYPTHHITAPIIVR